MSKYELVNDQYYGQWINKPNNMGDVGDLRDITDELNRLLSERDEAQKTAVMLASELAAARRDLIIAKREAK